MAFDPSVFERGLGALLVRQDALRRYLADNDLKLFWTVLGEKQLVGGWSRNEAGWLGIDELEADDERDLAGGKVALKPLQLRAVLVLGAPAGLEARGISI